MADIYVLGTGLSHNGSVVLLKNGNILVGIEKERLSRIKHDGGNDNLAIQYCLDAAGIQLQDVALVVQCANFEIPDRDRYQGERLFSGTKYPPIVNISHHLAHAYSAVGTSPFKECAVMVIDGCGSPLNQYLSIHPDQKSIIPQNILKEPLLQCEKDSFYHFNGSELIPLVKDFSILSNHSDSVLSLPTTVHSIGGFYAAISHYVFGNMDDVGKLMGLAPFGNTGVYDFEAFEFEGSSLRVKQEWKNHFTKPASSYDYFNENFNYYASVAKWAQEQVEKAVVQCITLRLKAFPHDRLCYSGGVALNAVANTKLIEQNLVKEFYVEPAAADNGLALGCAYYGWLTHLKMPKKKHNGSTCFGKVYSHQELVSAIEEEQSNQFNQRQFNNEKQLLAFVANVLNEGKTVAWFHSGSEFGPRSLGRRSILAHPGKSGLKNHINRNIKFREDFRPFAPAVLKKEANTYFESGRSSPYMIQVDATRPEFLKLLANVTHCDGSARVQTVDDTWNPRFSKLLLEFKKLSGIPVLLNTSLNRKGIPMVETPKDALQLFKETALDILVLEDIVLEKDATLLDQTFLEKILQFLNEININVVEQELDDACFLPGLSLKKNAILLDRKRLKYPGDLLHEAGHLAVTEEDKRKWMGTDQMPDSWPGHGEEIGAILWSYAALRHLNIPATVVFHANGYKNDSEWLIEQFENENYIGLSLLEWMGLCNSNKEKGLPVFPQMIKWLR